MAKRWQDVKNRRLNSEQLDKIRRAVEEEILEMNLRELRELTGKTQDEVARAASMTQSDLSRTERRDDHLISTLRRCVAAMGGELEVVAVFENKRVRLRGV